MKGSFFQRHLAEQSFAKAKSWPEQVELSNRGRPTNAEYELWTQQLHQEINGIVDHKDVDRAPKVNTIADSNGSHKANGTI